MSAFTKATRKRVFLKIGITGTSGSGKTYSALRLASGLAESHERICFLDTENKSASLYADEFDFDVLDIAPPYTDTKFILGLQSAINEGYKVAIIDSASHFWEGILQYKGALDAKGGNSYTNWNQAGEKFSGILASVLQSPIHVICCLRSKQDYVLETNDKGKQAPRKIGLAPIMRDGIEYEFTTVLDIGQDHSATTSKDRSGLFVDNKFLVTEDTGRKLNAWLNSAKFEADPSISTALTEEDKMREEFIKAIACHEIEAKALFLERGYITEDQTPYDLPDVRKRSFLKYFTGWPISK